MKKTWYLIKTDYWDYPTWRLKIERGGQDWFVSEGGGGMPITGKEEILETKDVKYENELDWSVTSYGHYREDFGNGWLSPAGEWTQCDYRGHNDVAYYIMKSDEQSIEDKNYIKISGDYIFPTKNDRYTRKQIEWLKKHNHREHAEMLEEERIVV